MKLLKNLKIINVTLLPLVMLAGCLPTNKSSTVTGASAEEIRANKKGASANMQPEFDKLYSLVGSTKTLKIAIFVSPDREEYATIPQNIDKILDGLSTAPGLEGMPAFGLSEFGTDHGIAAFAHIKRWFHNIHSGLGFIRAAKVEGSNGKYKITGVSSAPGNSYEMINWEVTLRLGAAHLIGREFGEAMATHQIAMLNGHFYQDDAAAINAPSAQNNLGMEISAERSSRRLNAPPGFNQKVTSEIYRPAIEAFKAAAKDSDIDYRIVVFNGCMSEDIEDIVLAAAKEIGKENIQVIGMRGKSNYRYFAQQIAHFLKALTTKGSTWASVLDALKYNDRGSTPAPFFQQHPELAKVLPVLRNKSVGFNSVE